MRFGLLSGISVVVVLAFASTGALAGQSSTLSVAASRGLRLPKGGSSQVLALRRGGGLSVEYGFGGRLWRVVRLDVGYALNPTCAVTSLSTIFGATGGGVRLWPGPPGGLGLCFLLSAAFDLGSRGASGIGPSRNVVKALSVLGYVGDVLQEAQERGAVQ